MRSLAGFLAVTIAAATAGGIVAAGCTLDTAGTLGISPDASTGGTGGASLHDGGAGTGGGVMPIPDGGCFLNTKPCNGFCVPLDDPEYGCRPEACNPCTLPNATATCDGPECSIASCVPPFEDCNGDPVDGCETNVQFDPTNCGVCTLNCFAQFGADQTCIDGECKVSMCPSGSQDCDGMPLNGCEVDTNGDPNNCGYCFNECQLQHANEVCVAGTCGIGSCEPGFDDCDGNPLSGCEINLQSNTLNCTACNVVCNGDNGTPTCNGGCGILCNPGRGDCDGDPSNGCEVDLTTNVDRCGSCGNRCSTNGGTPSCSAGKCGISCNPDRANCDKNVGNGCEVNRATDVNNCGGCNKACSTVGGMPICMSGTCDIACNGGRGNCDGNAANGCETDTATDVNNCGSCNQGCPGGHGTPFCMGGSCDINCDNGRGNCDGNLANGCETNTTSDVGHCGGCNAPCSSKGGTPSCSGGVCDISCTGSNRNCNNDVSDGCEVNIDSDLGNCGDCGKPCTRAHAIPVCSGGGCDYVSCNPPYADCDGDRDNGCEVNTDTDKDNCGQCGQKCMGMDKCQNGSCN